MNPPEFDDSFLNTLDDLLIWRRDVRHFKTDPLEAGLLDQLLDRACLAPSVGNSQPWRFVQVNAVARREKIIQDFKNCNSDALSDYEGERAKLYASLKLAGLQNAPVHLAVFTDITTSSGHGLGRKTMPEMLHYSTICMIMSLWLIARARGVGIGWVSILNPGNVTTILDVPEGWTLGAYLCVGYPEKTGSTPELERLGWQTRESTNRSVLER
ncbi:MAG: 5,6-dimethylbenzimidazole synthase [Halioglobus sp.]